LGLYLQEDDVQSQAIQDNDDSCAGFSSARLDSCSSNVTPLAVPLRAHEAAVSTPCISSGQLPVVLSSEALASQFSKMGEVTSSDSAAADGLSLVHRSAGTSFVNHVLSKGNSIDVWQGFLSFVGEMFLFQRVLQNSPAGQVAGSTLLNFCDSEDWAMVLPVLL
jgi:hypothetical protein